MIFRVAQNSSTNAPFGVLILFSYRELAAPYGEALTLATRDAVPYEQIKKIIHRGQQTTTKIELDVKVGDKVRIVSGPFAEFIGDITEVYPDKSKLRANVSIFGRETPDELEYKQIQKI